MKTKLHLLLAAGLLMAACSAKEPTVEPFDLNGTCWTDGYEFFVGQPDTITHDSSLFLFIGGNLHEGGYGFALQRLSSDTFLIRTIPGSPMVAVGMEGDTATLDSLASGRILVCHRPNDPECDTLEMYDPGDMTPYDAFAGIIRQKRLDDLKGVYTDAKSGMTFEFADSLFIRTSRDGKPDTATFHIFYSFDMPTHALILSSGEKLWYEKTAVGLDLFTAKYWIAEEDYSQDKPLYRLTRQ